MTQSASVGMMSNVTRKARSQDEGIKPNDFRIDSFRDGALVLTCGKDGMESDLVFAAGSTTGSPVLEKQKAILEFILTAVSLKHKACI